MPREHGCWPTDLQCLLLRAALLDGEEGVRASYEWRRRIDLDRVDAGSFRLLPLLFRAMIQRGEAWSELGRLRGVHRQTWYKNSLLIGRLAPLLGALETAGIPTLLLKGVPLSLRYYGDTALRPMADADLLVPTKAAVAALQVVTSGGWKQADPRATWPPRFTASRAFIGPLDLEMDLHCHVLHESRGATDDDAFWAAAEPLEVGGVATRALHPADQLLHVLVHGFRRSTVPPLRWVADATVVIRESGSRLDWARFVEQAQRRRLALLTGRALRFVEGLLGVGVPVEVLRALDAGPHSLGDRLECWGREEPGLARLVVEKWSEFRRAAGREPEWSGPFGFARYVRDQLGLAHTWQLTVAVPARIAQRRS